MSENRSQQYWESVRSIAEEALADCNVTTQEQFEDERDSVYDNARESVDGCSWIIYNSNNLDVIQFTDNEEAYKDIGLEGCQDFSDICCRVAFCAMEQDVYEALTSAVEDLPENDEETEEDDQPVQVAAPRLEVVATLIHTAFEDVTTGLVTKGMNILTSIKPDGWTDGELITVVATLTEFRAGKKGLEQTTKEILALIE